LALQPLTSPRSISQAASHLDPPSFPTRRSSDLSLLRRQQEPAGPRRDAGRLAPGRTRRRGSVARVLPQPHGGGPDWRAVGANRLDRKSTRLNSSHVKISYAVFCLKKKRDAVADL